MAAATAPFIAQDVGEVRAMVQGLESHCGRGKGKGGFAVKKHVFTLPNGNSVTSWRMQDWDYKKPNLPTYARGLFTCQNSKGNPEIVVRGYDKFFNHGEVRNTEWSNVEKNTRGPYELSVKENGCIIFIAGMEDGTLLVCSKHSTGVRDNVEVSHAMAGERWVEKHLAAVGKTKRDLALKLREMNATAVAELCDDEFEEHVLAYDAKAAGLYLHGINLNLPKFATYPGRFVDDFADAWGLKKTMYIVEDDITEVKRFLDKTAETGAYAGRDTEGFVIRCQARDSASSAYEDWFFKYKFEEPYLMYRQWREATKAIISGKAPYYKKHKQITEEYLLYARRRFVQDPKLTLSYNQNHGIIQLREDFLKERGLTGAEVISRELNNDGGSNTTATPKVVLVPIATIGCGKTTVALALAKLFGWGHVQNDDIVGKKMRMERFAQAVGSAVTQSSVVIADKNNHQKRERQQLFTELDRLALDVQFVALHWTHDNLSFDEIRRVTRDRVLSRGDNHQTIRATSKGSSEVITIMEGFLYRFEPLNRHEAPDNRFELVIDLDIRANSRDNLETIISAMYEAYPALFIDMPSPQAMDKAIEEALHNYEPSIKHDLGSASANGKAAKHVRNGAASNGPTTGSDISVPKKQSRVEYFGVRVPPTRVPSILDACFRDQPVEVAKMYRQLRHTRRIQNEFHVTLMHRASEAQNPGLWKLLNDQYNGSGSDRGSLELRECKVALRTIVWDSRLMCIVAELGAGKTAAGDAVQWQTSNAHPHITVGTASAEIKPKESNDLLARWQREGCKDGQDLYELQIPGDIVLEGLVKVVLSK